MGLERFKVNFRTLFSMDRSNRSKNLANALHDVYLRIFVQIFSDGRRQEVKSAIDTISPGGVWGGIAPPSVDPLPAW